jgi:hypothetical protein
MSRVVYLRAVKNKPAKPVARRVFSSRAQELAREARNCMLMLFLALAMLERDGEQWKAFSVPAASSGRCCP